MTPSWDGHLLLLHGSEGERLARLAAWVRDGLQRGEKVVYSEPTVPAHRSVLARLRGRGIDVDAATVEGRFEVVAPSVFSTPEGQGVVVDRALDGGFPAVRISGEAAAALTVFSAGAYQVIEQQMDRLCQTRPVSALCQYARPTTVGAALRTAIARHPRGVRELGFASTTSVAGLVVHGEVDADNCDVLAAVVTAAGEAARSGGRDELRLDLAAVGFCDVAACRTLAEASRGFRAGGRRVLFVDPPPMVERVMRLVGLDGVPGVELVGSPQ
jgi:anti-anti-sigma factor